MSTREYSKFSLQLNTDYYYGSVLRSIPEPDTFMYNPLADLAPHMVPTYSLPVPSIVRAWYVLVQSVAASPTRLALSLPLPSASRRRCALRVCRVTELFGRPAEDLVSGPDNLDVGRSVL